MAGLFRRRGTALLLVIVSAFLVAAIACEGTQGGRGSQGSSGPPGSQGSSGLQGPQGEAGPQGDSGDEGPTGTTGGSAAVLVVHDTANNVAGARGTQVLVHRDGCSGWRVRNIRTDRPNR